MIEPARATDCKHCSYILDDSGLARLRLAAFARRMNWASPRAPSRSEDFNSDIHFMRYRPIESTEVKIDALKGRRPPAAGPAHGLVGAAFIASESDGGACGDEGTVG
jgi:predicted dithiol-disulfide oxidoreductase (DUF899 family)